MKVTVYEKDVNDFMDALLDDAFFEPDDFIHSIHYNVESVSNNGDYYELRLFDKPLIDVYLETSKYYLILDEED